MTVSKFNSRPPGLIKGNTVLELFYDDPEEIKPNHEDREKDFQKRKVVVNTASELYNELLNIYTIHYDKFLITQKKRISILEKPENLILNYIQIKMKIMYHQCHH